VTVATLCKLLKAGVLDPDADTVVFNTGDGLKTLDAIASHVGPTAPSNPPCAPIERPVSEVPERGVNSVR